MGKQSKKNTEPEEILNVEEEVLVVEEPKQQEPEEIEEPVLMASRIFVEKLKGEKSNKGVSPSVFVAFMAVVPKVDTEENYRNIWKKTFKRS